MKGTEMENKIAAGFDPIKHWEGEMSQEKFDKAKQCLIDNGIESDEAENVLQALCYILMGVETERFMAQ